MTTFLYFYDLFRLSGYSKQSTDFVNGLSKNKAFQQMSMESVSAVMANYYGSERG